jgi:nucleotide-binding universal stress UspA family protein
MQSDEDSRRNRRLGAIRQFVLGSIASAAVHRAELPVTLVK